ncbi:acrosomal protein KIAA1210 homolog isoform X5 [Tympanuchus pallidicinctus]|uniref:acrosomal protein KIAA1210 homolog isoform X5 n=1 Tax=Tympanuchus pallidicinctus TaxID=109042 RepID=UPI002286FC0A|nr:acrosomal protein KIAA1210 homolog isoform X5 [Tympanuchus pallidicinctus]
MAGFYSCLRSENDYIMATGPTDVIQSPEPGETAEEYTGKKKSRFQTFKNFFAKKKRKEPPPPRGESNLKPSQSIRDVSIYVLDANPLHSPKEAGPKGNMGNKALSHDSVFIFESVSGSAAGDTSSQECIPGRVKMLQLQLQQNIRLGSPPLVITGKKTEDAGTVSEDDGLPRSPPDISTLHEVLTDSPSKSSNPVQRHSSLSLGGTDSEDEQIPSGDSSWPISPSASAAPGAAGSRGSSSLPIDFTIPASPLGCLDTSAARHRIAINPRRQKGFTSKSQQSQVEHIEKEACLYETPEKKGNPTELLESDQHKSDWEGLSAHVEHGEKGGGSKETPSVKCPADADPDSYSSTLMAEDSCTLLQEDACLPDVDHHCNAATSLLRPESPPVSLGEQHSAAVPQCSGETSGELNLHQQNTDTEASALPKSQQTEAGAVVLPGILAANLFSSGTETESITALAYVAQNSPAKSVDQNVKDQEKVGTLLIGKVEASLGINESCSNQSVLNTALSTSQVAVADSECSDVKTVDVLKSDNSSVTRNDSETCEKTEFQPSKGSAGKKTDTAASVLEAGCMLPPSKLELCLKAAIPCPVSKDNHVSQQTCTSHASEKLSIESLASSSLAGLTCNVSSNDDCKYQVSSTASHRKPEKDSQSSEENIQSLLKTAAAKPVRFTIAPAWQRSLSGGSNSKEDSYMRSSPTSPVRPELFEGITKQHAVIQDSMKNNSNRFDRDCRDGDLHLNSSLEWADHEAKSVENPFGVKLRRTSSLLKYQSESRAESPKLLPSAASTASAAVKEDQKPASIGKPSPSLPVSTTSFLKQADLEDRSPAKTRSEEGTKKQNGTKPSEKVFSLHLETASSEPAWISVAKLKQKGFQDHPLAKEQKAEEQTSSKVDREEQVICGSENIQKNMPSSLRTQEKKPQMKTSVCAAAGKVGPIAQEASVIPAVEKETRHSSNLPMTPCSPAEPPWLSLAKKKAKAWSEMPQIVQ